ncbi:MAG: N-acetylmuramoyl-L-alanine amidase [Pseudomonadota bacterium]
MLPRRFRIAVLAAALAVVAGAGQAVAAELRAIGLRHAQGATRAALELSAPGGWRVFALEGPPRLVVDLEAGKAPAPPEPPPGGLVAAVRSGLAAPGRARVVFELARPARLAEGVMTRTADGARLRLAIAPADGMSRTGWPDGPVPASPPASPGDPRPLVMIDPGHGGMDPGAVRGETVEKEIVLVFARALAAEIAADGRWRAALTREDDRYLGLRERVGRAEAAGAEAFLSIHANTVARGDAEGASVFTLAATASDAQTRALAMYENQADVTAGTELSGEPDDVARAVVELSRRATNRASRRLGGRLAKALGAATPMLRGREHAQAGFRVLKSPRIASALLELGFLTNSDDLARMRDPAWRREAAQAVLEGLEAWRGGPGGRLAAR